MSLKLIKGFERSVLREIQKLSDRVMQREILYT